LGLQFAVWKFGFSYYDEKALLDFFEIHHDLLQWNGKRPWFELHKDYDQKIENFFSLRKTPIQKVRTLFTGLATPAISRYFLSGLRCETDIQMTLATIALKRYSLQHNDKYPRTLDSLVPHYLDKVPFDLMGAIPLSYHLNENGTYMLYSVGENGVDDGGDAKGKVNRATTTLAWEGNDIIWPKPATPEEAAEYDPAYAQ
jgi:hypothetical protein